MNPKQLSCLAPDDAACRKQDVIQYPDTSQAYLPRLLSCLPSGERFMSHSALMADCVSSIWNTVTSRVAGTLRTSLSPDKKQDIFAFCSCRELRCSCSACSVYICTACIIGFKSHLLCIHHCMTYTLAQILYYCLIAPNKQSVQTDTVRTLLAGLMRMFALGQARNKTLYTSYLQVVHHTSHTWPAD